MRVDKVERKAVEFAVTLTVDEACELLHNSGLLFNHEGLRQGLRGLLPRDPGPGEHIERYKKAMREALAR